MPNWDEIRKEWETTKKTYKELEEQFNVKSSTIRSRKNREKWERNATEKNRDSVATKKKSVATELNGEQRVKKKKATSKVEKKERTNRSGNPNPKNQFTERNNAALKHGLFSRYIPKETLDIMGTLEKSDPADLIWDQIQIQYAAIIRAQQIMFVTDKDEMIKELKKEKIQQEITGENEDGETQTTPTYVEQEYEFQFAWDRHATFLNAQSRAISELRTSIRQFVDMTNDDDERRLKLDLMQSNINKVKAETDKITKENETDAPPEITIVDAWTDKNE